MTEQLIKLFQPRYCIVTNNIFHVCKLIQFIMLVFLPMHLHRFRDCIAVEKYRFLIKVKEVRINLAFLAAVSPTLLKLLTQWRQLCIYPSPLTASVFPGLSKEHEGIPFGWRVAICWASQIDPNLCVMKFHWTREPSLYQNFIFMHTTFHINSFSKFKITLFKFRSPLSWT